MLPPKLKLFFQLASLISDFLKATQMFSSLHLRSLCVCSVILSLLNIAMSSTGDFFYNLITIG